MAYKTDGTPHYNGINGEDAVLIYFNDKLNYDFISTSINKALSKNEKFKPFNFIKKGGTQNREDIFCINNQISISVKSKKKQNKTYKGTFDLINTSSIRNFICSNEKYDKRINEWFTWLENIKNKEYSYSNIKKEVENYCRLILNSINGTQIKQIFLKIFEMEGSNIEVIRDYSNSINESITNDCLHFLKHSWFNEEFEKNIDENQNISSSKTSAFIKTKNGENSVFRIRVVTNNGVSALMRELGISPKINGKNNNSSLTLKIQVDKVMEVINKYDFN